MSMGAAGEVVLPRRAHTQPSPIIHQPGDCGACALGGALGISIAEVYTLFGSEGITGHSEMARCARCASTQGLADRIIDEPAEWPRAQYLRSFGYPARHQHLPWFQYVRMAIDAGYYGLACVDMEATGGPDTNHWLLICGARTEARGRMTGEVLTSCSVRGERWIEAREFLRDWGGYDVLFVRPMGERHDG